MPADEMLDLLCYHLDQKDVLDYQAALQLWGTMTVNASAEEKKASMPKKPASMQDMFGD